MRVTASFPTGVAALLFEGARHRRRLERTMVDRLDTQGFAEVVLPVVDYLEPYEAMLSARSRGELYRFVDRDGEVLALRSDFTPMLARLLAPRLPSLDLPLRVFYRGDVLRYQEARAGRERELYQLGAEVLGRGDGEAAEAEVLERFLELLEVGDRRRLLVVVGVAGALDGLLLGSEPSAESAAGSDTDSTDEADDATRERDARFERAVALADAVVRRERSVARSASGALGEVVEHGVPDDLTCLGPRAAARVERLRALLERLSERFPAIDLRLDLAEFADQAQQPGLRQRLAGRAYYDGLVFRAFAGAAAEPVGGGGRYDRLFQRLGADLTAAGFSFSLDRLMGRELDPPAQQESRS